jgi:hypothetical protein
MDNPFVSTGFFIVTEKENNLEEWGVGFSLVIEGEIDEVDWTQ